MYFYDRFFNIQKKKQYILPEQAIDFIEKSFAANKIKIKISDIASVYEIDEKINPYTVDNKKIKNVIIVRSGGFGDIIALSGLANYLLEKKNISKVVIYTRHFYIDGLNLLFTNERIKIKGIYKDTVEDYVINNDLFGVVYFEGLIENSKENWYDIHYKRIKENHEEVDSYYKRPIFDLEKIDKNLKRNNDNDKVKILLVPRSTSYTRSTRLIDMVNILKKLISESNFDIKMFKFYVHKENITGTDISDIPLFNDIDLEVIEKSTLKDFVLDLYNSDFVFTVDTAAIHLAEGFKKPAVGLYNSFSTNSRNKYYTYTKSIDVISDCELQPCFIHPTDFNGCPKFKDLISKGIILDKDISPCLDSRWNTKMFDYIVNNVKEYFYDSIVKCLESKK